MNSFSHVPPGFRFHPTEEELVDYYLRKKIASKRIDLDVIKEIDLYRIEPWDLQELCRIGTEEQNEWYFFSHKDKKYPTGTRTNRATKAGFWKATGRDKAIYSKHSLIGMRKTLVFYKGRAPNGQKSDWIMHEYRLETNENGTPQEEGWVVCRVFMKKMPTTRKDGDHESLCWYEDQVSFMPDFNLSRRTPQPYNNAAPFHPHYTCKQELELHYNTPHDAFLQLPDLESPKIPQSTASSLIIPYGVSQSSTLGPEENIHISEIYSNNINDQVTDWRVLDKFVASQLSQDEGRNENTYSNEHSDRASEKMSIMQNDLKGQSMITELTSVSTSSSQVDLWK